jgi:hypothetical protein
MLFLSGWVGLGWEWGSAVGRRLSSSVGRLMLFARAAVFRGVVGATGQTPPAALDGREVGLWERPTPGKRKADAVAAGAVLPRAKVNSRPVIRGGVQDLSRPAGSDTRTPSGRGSLGDLAHFPAGQERAGMLGGRVGPAGLARVGVSTDGAVAACRRTGRLRRAGARNPTLSRSGFRHFTCTGSQTDAGLRGCGGSRIVGGRRINQRRWSDATTSPLAL